MKDEGSDVKHEDSNQKVFAGKKVAQKPYQEIEKLLEGDIYIQ